MHVVRADCGICWNRQLKLQLLSISGLREPKRVISQNGHVGNRRICIHRHDYYLVWIDDRATGRGRNLQQVALGEARNSNRYQNRRKNFSGHSRSLSEKSPLTVFRRRRKLYGPRSLPGGTSATESRNTNCKQMVDAVVLLLFSRQSRDLRRSRATAFKEPGIRTRKLHQHSVTRKTARSGYFRSVSIADRR